MITCFSTILHPLLSASMSKLQFVPAHIADNVKRVSYVFRCCVTPLSSRILILRHVSVQLYRDCLRLADYISSQVTLSATTSLHRLSSPMSS